MKELTHYLFFLLGVAATICVVVYKESGRPKLNQWSKVEDAGSFLIVGYTIDNFTMEGFNSGDTVYMVKFKNNPSPLTTPLK